MSSGELLTYLLLGGPPIVFGYLLGSIPFGLVITKLAGLGDIRAIGSGNIGATNVLRTGRKDLALATLLLDSGKAGLAFLLSLYWTTILFSFAHSGQLQNQDHDQAKLASEISHGAFMWALPGGAMAFVGHCFPVWLKFKGGKGVATFIGLLLASMWQVGLSFCGIWLVMALLFRMSSFSALVATFAAPFLVAYFGYGPFAVEITAAVAVLIFWLHRANISRIMKGQEPKIGAKKKAAEPPGTAP